MIAHHLNFVQIASISLDLHIFVCQKTRHFAIGYKHKTTIKALVCFCLSPPVMEKLNLSALKKRKLHNENVQVQ
jgi:hypothetical protein